MKFIDIRNYHYIAERSEEAFFNILWLAQQNKSITLYSRQYLDLQQQMRTWESQVEAQRVLIAEAGKISPLYPSYRSGSNLDMCHLKKAPRSD